MIDSRPYFIYPKKERSPIITEKVRETLLTYLNEKSCEECAYHTFYEFLFNSNTRHLIDSDVDSHNMITIINSVISDACNIYIHINLNEPVFRIIRYDFVNKQQSREFFKRFVGDNNEIMSYLFLKGII